MPRPIPNRHCKVRSPNKIIAINWIVSNGPHGKFMAARGDHYFVNILYHDQSENKFKTIKYISSPLRHSKKQCFKSNGIMTRHLD